MLQHSLIAEVLHTDGLELSGCYCNTTLSNCPDSGRCLLLDVLSLVHCCSMILAEARVHQSYHPPESSVHQNGLSQGQLLTVIFSLRTVKHLSLKVGHLIKIHPPW